MIPVGARGVDYAYGRPTIEWFKRNKFTFAVRYISTAPSNPAKNLTRNEANLLLTGGISILLVWEITAERPNGGRTQGIIDGKLAKQEALKLGYPLSVPILVAIDTDTYWGNIDAHEAYIKGFYDHSVPYSIGIYGDADILLRMGNICRIGWLPNARSWSQEKRAQALQKGLIHVLQERQQPIDGIVVDPNEVIKEIPAWSRLTPTPIPVTPITEEDTMQVRYNTVVFDWNGFGLRHVASPKTASLKTTTEIAKDYMIDLLKEPAVQHLGPNPFVIPQVADPELAAMW